MPTNDQTRTAAEHRLVADPNIGLALTTLDDLAGWGPGTARSQVTSSPADLANDPRKGHADPCDRPGLGGARLPACEIVRPCECQSDAGVGHQPVFSSDPGLVVCRHSGLCSAAYVRN